MPSLEDVRISAVYLSHGEKSVGELPVRFLPTLAKGGMPLWQIVYHTGTFDAA
jgi:hypothetical protein